LDSRSVALNAFAVREPHVRVPEPYTWPWPPVRNGAHSASSEVSGLAQGRVNQQLRSQRKVRVSDQTNNPGYPNFADAFVFCPPRWEATEPSSQFAGHCPIPPPSTHRRLAAAVQCAPARGKQTVAPLRWNRPACCKTPGSRERSPRRPPPPGSCCGDEYD
jgi:hypothetical protein